MGLLQLMEDPQLGIWNLVFFVIAILLALTVHEFAHASDFFHEMAVTPELQDKLKITVKDLPLELQVVSLKVS